MNPKLKKLESLMLEYLKTKPFHNIFILHEIDIKNSKIGGTCSDMTLEFKEILLQNGFFLMTKLQLRHAYWSK